MRSQAGLTLLLILLAVILVPLGLFFVFPDVLSRYVPFFERVKPEFSLSTLPHAIGGEPSTLTVGVADSGVGLDELIIRGEQGIKRFEILKKAYAHEPKDTVSFTLNAKELGLREGPFKLKFSVFDGSFWNNGAETNVELRILYSKPKVEVLTPMHNVAQGGSNLVFYRLLAGEVIQSGLKVGELFFPGFPAAFLDRDFIVAPDVYFAFFAVPKDFNSTVQKLSVVARDIAGNSAGASVNYLILKRKFRSTPMKLSEDYMRSKLPHLLEAYNSLSKSESAGLNAENAPPSELLLAFRTVNENYRALLNKKIRGLLSRPIQERRFELPFSRALAGSPTSQFGEQRNYSFEGEPVSSSIHDGLDLAATANQPVKAANGGKVVFADDLGIYGNTVIIDHGFGLSTLYSHLSSITVSLNDDVVREAVIGRSGATGLAGGDHLHFEIRVNGYPVTPIEWWDGKWVKDHILERIDLIKRQLAIEARTEVGQR